MSKRGINPWNAAEKRRKVGLPPKWMHAETQFEAVLREAGALSHPRVKEWVKKNHRTHFVPENVLLDFGINPYDCVISFSDGDKILS